MREGTEMDEELITLTPENLARELIQLHAERSVRIAGEGKDSYRIERKA